MALKSIHAEPDKYIMHVVLWIEEDEAFEAHPKCQAAVGIDIYKTRVYVQDAIDVWDAEGCPVCLPDPDKIAHDVWVVRVEG